MNIAEKTSKISFVEQKSQLKNYAHKLKFTCGLFLHSAIQ